MSHRERSRILIVAFASLLVASGCSKGTGPSHERFDGAYHAAKALEGATGIGVSYQRFQELLQELSTEVLIARDFAATGEDSLMVQQYGEALVAFHDGGILWKNKVDNAQYESLYHGQIVYSPDIVPIVEKYGLKTQHDASQSGTFKFTSVSGDAIERVWEVAARYAGRADSLYLLKVGRHRG